MKKGVNITNLKQEFGMAVLRERHKLNLSQENFANIVDIHRTYVSSIELGKVDVGLSVAFKIARALKLPLSKLIKKTESHLSK